MLNTIVQGDCYELMKGIPDGSIDLVLTDPPYNTIAADWDKQPIDLTALWQELKRVAKPDAAFVFTASQPFTTDLINSNRKWFKYCWVWVKNRPTDKFNAKNKPMKIHEDICIFSNAATANGALMEMIYNAQDLVKSGKVVRGATGKRHHGERPSWKDKYILEYTNYPTSVLYFSKDDTETTHPTQKPLSLFEYLIRTYTNPGETVLDPFGGSGTTALAAHATGRQFLLFEKEPKYVEIANKRLALAQMQGRFEEMVG